jgi:hypothetical protein
MATPFQLFCPCQIASYPRSCSAAPETSRRVLQFLKANDVWLLFRQQRSNTGSRPLTPFTL